MKRKQNWLIYLLAITTVILSIAKILNTMSENNKVLPQSSLINAEDKTKFNINFTGSTPNLPEQLLAYNFLAQKPDNLINTLKQNYALIPHSSSDTIWNGKTNYLTLNEKTDEYEFGLNQAPNTLEIIDQNKALNVALDFIKNNFSETNLQVDEKQTKFYQGNYQLSEVTLENASLINFSFNYFINNYPVLISQQEFAPIRIMINSEYKVQKAIFYPLLIKVSDQLDSKLITLEEAVKNINQGKATIISAYQDINHLPDISELSGSLSNVELEYRTDETLGLIYPYYKFTGDLTNKDGTTEVQIITPAIKTK